MTSGGQASPLPEGFESVDDPEQIRLQLERILTNPEFQASKRNRTFLRYVVEETLAGRARFIKGYSIAQSVFNRDASFDPQLDPVVRIEAGRLRRSLERYYLTAGKVDPIQIDIPKGGYVAIFKHCVDEAGVARPEPTLSIPDIGGSSPVPDRSIPSVIVLPFRDLGTGQEFLAAGMTEELICALAQFNMLRVFGTATSFRVATEKEPLEVGQDHDVDYVVHGAVRTEAARLRITTRLLRVADGAYVWSKSFDRQFQVDSVIAIETDIARTIATALGAPQGTIARFSEFQFRRGVPPNFAAYECLLRWYHFRRTSVPRPPDTFRAEVEKATRLSPDYADIWAVLAYLFVDEFRRSSAALAERASLPDEALIVARRAVGLDAESSLARLALSIVHFHRHDLDQSSREAAKALELTPYNPEVLLQVGWRTAVSGDWERGMSFMREGRAFDPNPPNWCRLIFALDAYRRGDRDVALNEIRNGTILPIPLAYVTRAAILAEFGELEAAISIAAKGSDVFPGLFEYPDRSLAFYNFEPAITRRLLESLKVHGISARGTRSNAAGA
jgi:adenylate cyclase